jgi:hypothetical protein
MTEKDKEKRPPKEIKEALDDVVHKLEQDTSSRESWGASVSGRKGEWEELKQKIKDRQRALKALVMEKKAGTIGQAEFDQRYRVLQNELTELEFQVYNLRLGTDVK